MTLTLTRHDFFTQLWKDRTNPGGIIQNPLVDFAKHSSFEDSEAMNYKWEFKVEPVTVFEYIGQVLAWMRVSMIEEPNGGFNGAEYYATKVLLFDSLSEDWGAEATIGFKGQDLFDVLATKLDADPDSEEYKRAYKCIWRLLTKSSMQKITHGENLTKGEAVGVILDKKENEGKDVEPGSFAELLRYGSVHFRQERKIDYVQAKKPEEIIKKGLFEA